jgi:hypothetical protein
MDGRKVDDQIKEELRRIEAAGGGGGGGTVGTVKDGDTTVTSPTTIDFAGDAVVTESPAGTAVVTVTGGGGTLGTGFSPKPIATCTGEVGLESGDKTMLYLTIVEHDMTIGKATVYGNETSDGEFEVAIYRGSGVAGNPWGGNLIGRGSREPGNFGVYGPNDLDITAEVGENLDVVAGEHIIVGMRGTSATSSWAPIGGNCNMERMYAQKNSPPGTVVFPATSPDDFESESWEEIEEIFGLTLWADAE